MYCEQFLTVIPIFVLPLGAIIPPFRRLTQSEPLRLVGTTGVKPFQVNRELGRSVERLNRPSNELRWTQVELTIRARASP
jgi:hypothetical protein